MVDVQRNVVIQLGLAADPKNEATAKLVESQAKSVVTAGGKAYDELRVIASNAQKQINEIHKIQTGIRLDIDRQLLSDQIALQGKILDKLVSLEERKTDLMEKAAADRQKALDDAEQKRQDAAEKKRLKTVKKLQKKIEDIERSRIENSQKANESAVAAVQGIADMVEGMAKLGLVSEENYETFAKNFDMIQEGIRVFKGFTDVIWKGREALIALSAVTNGQTTANNLMAVSAARAATAQGAGAAGTGGARGAGSAALGVGTDLAIGAGGARLAAGGSSVLGGAKVLAGATASAATLIGVAVAGAEAIQFVRQQIQGVSDATESPVGALYKFSDAVDDAVEASKKTAKKLKERDELYEERKFYTSERTTQIGLQGQIRASRNRVGDAYGIAGKETGIQNAERVRLEAIREVMAAEEELADQQRFDQQRSEQGFQRANELRLKLLSDQEEAQKRLYDAEVREHTHGRRRAAHDRSQ